MRAHRMIAAGLAAAAVAGLTALAPAARAGNPAPTCDQGGSAPGRNMYYYTCEILVPGNPAITWSGAPITRGQGTDSILGTCIGGSLTYYITATWTISGVTASGTTALNCRSGGGV